MNFVFNKLRKVLNEQFSYQLELETKFELEVEMDYRKMWKWLMKLETTFGININFDHIDFLSKEKKL